MKYKLLLLAACTVAIASCGTKAPECSDQQVQDLAIKIVKDRMLEQMSNIYPMGIPDQIKENTDKLQLKLDAIRTTATDEKTGAQQCAAELNAPNGKIPLTYTVELTSKKGEIYVTVSGI
jgi:hypothetical protein